jgi:phytoene synthase
MIAGFTREMRPPGDNSLDSLYAEAAAATKAGSRGFFFATRYFPLDLSHAAHAVYWFCHYTLRLGQQAATVEQGIADLDQWDSLVATGLRGRLARHPVLDVFFDTVDRRDIPHELPRQLIEGARLDIAHSHYASFGQLRARCQRIGGVVSQMMAYVVGFRDPALDYMGDLGIAIELTTLLRDTGMHLERGRIYLPADEMETSGYSVTELNGHIRDEAFRRLMTIQAQRIRDYYQSAELGLALLDARGRFAVRVAFDLYRHTLRRMESSHFDVFGRAVGLPAVERAWITARSMAGPITRRLWKAVGA